MSAGEGGKTIGPFRRARQRFLADPKGHLIIPVIAAIVGWVTNKLAVEMIFYPLRWKVGNRQLFSQILACPLSLCRYHWYTLQLLACYHTRISTAAPCMLPYSYFH